MINQVVIVGRLCSDPQIKELEKDSKLCYVTIACQRPYKNENGEYDTDFISCQMWNQVAESVAEYCKKGDLVGIKGRIQTSSYDNENGEKVYKQNVVVEKVSFLSSKKENNE